MPSSLEYLCFYPFGERSDRENRRFSRCSARPKGEERGALPGRREERGALPGRRGKSEVLCPLVGEEGSVNGSDEARKGV